MENCKFTLIWIQNIVTDMLVSEIVQKWISCENLQESCRGNGHGKSLVWSWKVMEKSWNFISNVSWESCKCWIPILFYIYGNMSSECPFLSLSAQGYQQICQSVHSHPSRLVQRPFPIVCQSLQWGSQVSTDGSESRVQYLLVFLSLGAQWRPAVPQGWP